MSPIEHLVAVYAANPRGDAGDLAHAALSRLTFEEIEAFARDCLFDEDAVVCLYDLAHDELVTVVCDLRGAEWLGQVH